jgi:hypothetical protein
VKPRAPGTVPSNHRAGAGNRPLALDLGLERLMEGRRLLGEARERLAAHQFPGARWSAGSGRLPPASATTAGPMLRTSAYKMTRFP